MLDRAVILAAGLGTRMQRADESARMSPEQRRVADSGVKAMIPIARPFLDYVLSALADAGYRRVCLVIGPAHDQVRDYYTRLASRRIGVEFAIQQIPRGTADALAAAETFAAGKHVLVINSDNYYPVEAFSALREQLCGSGLAAFTRDGLLRGNIPPSRIANYAIVRTDSGGRLQRVVEKPTDAELASAGEPLRISMNCWRFEPSIFEACRHIALSPRGEYEIPDAVAWAMGEMGVEFQTVTIDAPVLDLSRRSDLAGVKAALADVEVNL